MNRKFLLSFILTTGIITCTQASTYVECGQTAGDVITGDNANCWPCGATCVARLNSEGKMTVSGSGAIDGAKIVYEDSYNSKGEQNYHYESPWQSQKNNIKSLVIDEGITNIGSRLFDGYSAIKDIQLPDGLQTINWGTFDGTGISTITFPDSVTGIYNFNDSSSTLTNIVFEGNDLPDMTYSFLGFSGHNKKNLMITFNGSEKELNQLVDFLKGAQICYNENGTYQCAYTGATLKQMNADGTYSLYNGDDGGYLETYNANGTVYTPASYTVKTATERVNRIGGCEDVKCSLKMWFK